MDTKRTEYLASGEKKLPVRRTGWFRRLFAFSGPAYLVSVGYMDPGNWATDIEGGARFGYMLIWVLLLSNIMAILLQTLSARLGVVTGHDLAQGCRREYPGPIRLVLWGLAEIAIIATDLAEVLGTVVGLNMLFGIPLLVGCAVTAFDTLLLIALQRFGIRKLEAVIVTLVATIGTCFMIDVFLANPVWSDVARGFVPRLDPSALYIAIGIIGATVMPHNLYLHSSLVQSREISDTVTGKRAACRYNFVDSLVALNAAFVVNAAILIVAAADFHARGLVVTELGQAHMLLDTVLGQHLASVAFAVALLAAGQSSTITGTISGQIVMEGFLNLKITPWFRRLVTRLLALAPAVFAIALAGENGIYRLLILSQVVLSLQLPFAIIPLVQFTSDSRKMGAFANPRWVVVLSVLVAAIVIGLNGKLVADALGGWMAAGASWVWWGGVPAVAFLIGVLLYLVLSPWKRGRAVWDAGRPKISREVAAKIRPASLARIGVALQHAAGDSRILSAAVPLSRANRATLFLIHVVDTPGVLMMGEKSGGLHASADEDYLEDLAREVEALDLAVEPVLRFGRPFDQLVRAAGELRLDMLVLGSHGHRGLEDLVYGETVSAVRHRLAIPILVVRSVDAEPAVHLADRTPRDRPPGK